MMPSNSRNHRHNFQLNQDTLLALTPENHNTNESFGTLDKSVTQALTIELSNSLSDKDLKIDDTQDRVDTHSNNSVNKFA